MLGEGPNRDPNIARQTHAAASGTIRHHPATDGDEGTRTPVQASSAARPIALRRSNPAPGRLFVPASGSSFNVAERLSFARGIGRATVDSLRVHSRKEGSEPHFRQLEPAG